MASRGVALWMESLADSRAKTSRSPASGPESTARKAGSGRSSLESLGRFDPGSYSLKTCQVSLLTNRCDEFSETFPRSGSMRNGSVFERPMSALRTGGSGCSCWLSPVVPCRKQGCPGPNGQRQLDHQAMNWPTPDANAINDGETLESWERRKAKNLEIYDNGNGMGAPLAIASRQWPSPRSEDAESCGNHPGAMDSLTGASALWATPQAFDANDIERSPGALGRAKTKGGCANLRETVMQWPTPAARDHKSGDASRAMLEKNARPLNEIAQVWGTPRVTTSPMYGALKEDDRSRIEDQAFRFSLTAPDWAVLALSMRFENFTPKTLDELGSCIKRNSPTLSNGETSSKPLHGSRRQSHKLKLNVYFVENLMGLPANWTSKTARIGLGHSETWLAQLKAVLDSFSWLFEQESRHGKTTN